MRKFMSGCSIFMVIILVLLMIPFESIVFAEDEEHGVGCNCVRDTNYVPREPDYIIDSGTQSVFLAEDIDLLPAAVDNSTSLYFPVIGDQGSKGACAFFASVYYQFTYEKNRLNGTYARTSDGAAVNENVASPAFPYNLINYNENDGYFISGCAKFLRSYGCVSWNELPYSDADSTTFPSKDAIRNALNTRISSVYDIEINTGIDTEDLDGDGDVSEYRSITSPNSEQLMGVKTALNQGQILCVDMYADDVYWSRTNVEGSSERIIYRAASPTGSSNHSLTVVGYDDTVWCDINDDGVAQDAEKGAFKVANSWSTDWENDGFIWVAYDALNIISAVEGWTQPDEYRIPAFVYRYNSVKAVNNFQCIEVSEYSSKFILELTTDTTWFNRRVTLTREDTKVVGTPASIAYIQSGNVVDHVIYTLCLDYSELCEPLDSYRTGYTWSFSSSMAKANEVLSASIVDDLGNIIHDFDVSLIYGSDGTTPQSYVGSAEINLLTGDMDYDGVLEEEDAVTLLYYTMGSVELSNTQFALADVDGNGVIDTADARDLYAMALQSSSNPNAVSFDSLYTAITNNILLY